MADNVLKFTGATRLPIPPAAVLESAAAADLSEVLIVGTREDGDLMFFSSTPHVAEVLLMLEHLKLALLTGGTCVND